MLKALLAKLKESALSVFPVVLIVLALGLSPIARFTATETTVFILCGIALVVGMALFNLGADIAMTPMGEQIGAGLPKSGKFKTLRLVCFLMGVSKFFTSGSCPKFSSVRINFSFFYVC